jgi:hypothetical protein
MSATLNTPDPRFPLVAIFLVIFLFLFAPRVEAQEVCPVPTWPRYETPAPRVQEPLEPVRPLVHDHRKVA